MHRRGLVVAIDGPSGSGKSTVARSVAIANGLRYLDTGSMYRALTWLALRDGVPLDDTAGLTAMAERADLHVVTDPRTPRITVAGIDLTDAVRGGDVTTAVSSVSAVPGVRRAMVRRQRELIGRGGIVVEGRDIGTTVAPDAPVKIFLTADATTRAQRRAEQDGRGRRAATATTTVRATEADLRRRDTADAGRAASPLRQADDALVIDSSSLDVSAVVAEVSGRVRAAAGRTHGRATGPAAESVPLGVSRRIAARLLRVVLRLRVEGLEHIPAGGPVLLAGNHSGFLDGPIVFIVLPRPAAFLVKSELYDTGFRPVLRFARQIPIRRGTPDRTALRQGLAVLRAGGVLGVFPEGTRGTGSLASIQHGIGYIALQARCPIVPVVCVGTADALPKGRALPRWRAPVTVVFGRSFSLDVPGDPRARRTVAEAAEQIRSRLLTHLDDVTRVADGHARRRSA